MNTHRAPSHHDAGFTLAEVAVTLVIVGMCLVYVLQGLNTSRRTALHTYQKKVAREMAAMTLGQIEAGLFWEELEMGNERGNDLLQGTYAEEGYEDYYWEVAVGDDAEFSTRLEEDYYQEPSPTDTYNYNRMLEEERRRDAGEDVDDDELSPEPYQKVRVRVELRTEEESRVLITLERWIPWELVYGVDEEEQAASEAAAGDDA